MTWIGTALFLFGAIAVAALLLEALLRLANISYPSFYTVDETTSLALRPGAQGWWYRESKNCVNINSQGLRDREHRFEKPDGVLRIAVLGNSFCEALQVPQECTFWAELERELNNCVAADGITVEVVNFGVSNYSTAMDLLVLRHRVWRYEPDIVILTCLTATDILWNSPDLRQDPLMPYFRFREGQLLLDDSFRNHPAFLAKQRLAARLHCQLLAWSRVWQVINAGRQKIRGLSSTDTLADLPDRAREIYLDPIDSVWKEAWAVTEQIVKTLYSEVIARGAQFMLVSLDNPIQVNPDPTVRQGFMRRLGVSTLHYPDTRIELFAEKEKIPHLILAPILREYAEKHQVYLHGFIPSGRFGSKPKQSTLGRGHWNNLGHRVVGQLIAQKICTETLPKRIQHPVTQHAMRHHGSWEGLFQP